MDREALHVAVHGCDFDMELNSAQSIFFPLSIYSGQSVLYQMTSSLVGNRHILWENIIEMIQKDYQKWYMRKELKNVVTELLTQEVRKVVTEKQRA